MTTEEKFETIITFNDINIGKYLDKLKDEAIVNNNLIMVDIINTYEEDMKNKKK